MQQIQEDVPTFEGAGWFNGDVMEYWCQDNRWHPGTFVGLSKDKTTCFFETETGALDRTVNPLHIRTANSRAPQEIERRFFVTTTDMLNGLKGERLIQAYLSEKGSQLTTRVRLSSENKAWLTLKGRPANDSRGTELGHDEFEYAIPIAHAQALIEGYASAGIVKTRYRIPFEGHTFEVDVFEGNLAGLILAEVELATAAEAVVLPSWIGLEVTHDPQYRNVNLVTKCPPYAPLYLHST